MTRSLCVALVSLALLQPTAAVGQIQPPSTLDYLSDEHDLIQRDFGRCSVVLEKEAVAIERAGNTDGAARKRQIAQSARYIADFFALLRNAPPAGATADEMEKAKDMARSALAVVQSIVDAETERQRGLEEKGETDKDQLAFCAALERTQAFLHLTANEIRAAQN